MRETLLDLMIRFNEGNMLDPWNENEEELGDLDEILGTYRRGTLGSYQFGTSASAAGGTGSSGTAPGVEYIRDAPGGGFVGSYQGNEYTYGSPQIGAQAQPGTSTVSGGTLGGGTGGGFGGGVGGAPEETADYLSDYGKGLMEPGSDLSKRWMEQMREEVGKGTDAAQRAAAYQAAQSGFGSGASPELLQMQGDIGIAGREAAGDAASDYLLRAPELGIGAMGGALGSQVSMRSDDLRSKIASESNKLSRESINQGGQQWREELDYRKTLDEQDRDWEREQWEQEQGLDPEFVASFMPGGGGGAPAQSSWGGFGLGVK